ncbi:hypothetical protein ACJX0J_013164, partial [Zea mays]
TETTMEGLGSMAGYGSTKTHCWEERRRRAAGPRRGRLAPRYPTSWSTPMTPRTLISYSASPPGSIVEGAVDQGQGGPPQVLSGSSNTNSGRHWKTECKSVGRPPRWGDGSSSI